MRLAKGSHSKAQTILEYATLFAVIVAALIAMNIYLRRSFQGRYRELADEVGTQYEPGETLLIKNEDEPGYRTSTHSVTKEYLIDSDSGETLTYSTTETSLDRREETPAFK